MSISYTLKELAVRVNGAVVGDESVQITALCPLDEPNKNSLTFIKENHAVYLKKHLPSEYGAILISQSVEIDTIKNRGNFILVKEPYTALVSLIPLFVPISKPAPGVSSKADIARTAHIGQQVHIGAFVAVGERSTIGDNTIIHPHVVIYHDVSIGSDATIHAGAVIREGTVIRSGAVIQPGAVIGSDGFGYVPDAKLGLASIPQVGNVVIGENVDIGANACIDRATLGVTELHRGVKVDNLVQIGHNTKIGEYSILCGHVGVSGSCNIGKQVVLAGASGIVDHVTIPDGTRIGAQAAVLTDVPQKGDYAGHSVVPADVYRKNLVEWRDLHTTLRDLRKRVRQLEQK